MKCLRCGQEIDNNIAVCKYCGMDMTQYMRQGQSPQYSQPGTQQGQSPQYSQPGTQQGQSPQYVQPGMQSVQNQQYVQPVTQQAQAGQAVQAPQYSRPGMQPGQNQQYAQPGTQPGQNQQYAQPGTQQTPPGQAVQAPQYSRPGMQSVQNQQYVQPGMQQTPPGQAVQAPQYSQPGAQQPPQYSQWAAQQVFPQCSQQNAAGYYDMGNDADSSENGVKKVRYIPNIINIVGIVMALATLFIPYAHVGSDVRSIYSVFGIVVLPVIIGAVLVCGDVVCACINKTVCHIISMVISVILGGLYIFEFILSVIDLKKIDASLNAGFNIGAWISLVTAVVMIASVPAWWLLVARKRK